MEIKEYKMDMGKKWEGIDYNSIRKLRMNP